MLFSGVNLSKVTLVSALLHAPNLLPKNITSQLRLIDISPTILDLLGLQKNTQFQGTSLIDIIKNDSGDLPAFTRQRRMVSVRENDYKLIYKITGDDYLFFNLSNDPLEKNNLGINSENARKLRDQLENHINDLNKKIEELKLNNSLVAQPYFKIPPLI